MKKKFTFSIEGMSCASCVANSVKALNGVNGVSDVSINFATKKAILTFDDSVTNEQIIFNAVKRAGYNPVMPEPQKQTNEGHAKTLKIKLIISVISAFIVLYIAMAPMVNLPPLIDMHNNPVLFTLAQLFFTLIVMGAGYKFYTVGFGNLIKLKPNMDSLIALGTSAAFIYSLVQSVRILFFGYTDAAHNLFFESAAVIIALILLGKYLEMRTINKTGDAVKKLLDLSPKFTIVIRDGKEINIPVEQVKTGDILIVKPGGSIAVDGEIVNGSSYLDEAMLTGESVSVQKSKGDKVYAGTINKSGVLHYKAKSTGKDTVLAKIIEIVEQAQAGTAPIAKSADKVAGIFVPVVCLIAVVSFITWLIFSDLVFALGIMISVFVIACPCALGLATPAAIVTGTGKGASMGILFKSAESLQKLSEVNAFVFDKTGTLTEGSPYVADIFSANGYSKLDVLRACAYAEKGSDHPIAEAVLREADNREIKLDGALLENFKTHEGMGVEVTADGKKILAGTKKLFDSTIDDEILKTYEKFSSEGKTVVIISIDGNFAGVIAAIDMPKSDALQCVQALNSSGIKTYMLTGDNYATAQTIAKQSGIENVFAEVMPVDKANEIAELKKQYKVAMVGDGINDAPALATADVGIAVGGGTDIAIESADIVLTGKSLKTVADAYDLSRKTMGNIKQNLFWAFIYNILALPIAAGVLFPFFGILLNPMIAAFAMSVSSVSVVLNALRLNLFKSRFK